MAVHAGPEQLEHELDALADFLGLFGARFVTMSYQFESRSDVLESAAKFNAIGAACRERGLQFLYHNHDWEFVKFEGESALDLLLAATDPELVELELDVYWVKKGGEDPALICAS